MIPSPDLVFILDAPAEVLYSRKQELSIEEINAQRIAFWNFGHGRKNTFIVDVNRPVDDIVKDITSKILVHQSIRVSKIIKR